MSKDFPLAGQAGAGGAKRAPMAGAGGSGAAIVDGNTGERGRIIIVSPAEVNERLKGLGFERKLRDYKSCDGMIYKIIKNGETRKVAGGKALHQDHVKIALVDHIHDEALRKFSAQQMFDFLNALGREFNKEFRNQKNKLTFNKIATDQEIKDIVKKVAVHEIANIQGAAVTASTNPGEGEDARVKRQRIGGGASGYDVFSGDASPDLTSAGGGGASGYDVFLGDLGDLDDASSDDVFLGDTSPDLASAGRCIWI